MSLEVHPLADVFVVKNAPARKVLLEMFMVHNERHVCHNAFDSGHAVQHALVQVKVRQHVDLSRQFFLGHVEYRSSTFSLSARATIAP